MTENQIDQDNERDNFIAHVKQLTESQILNTNINVTGQNREHKFQN